MSRSKQKESDRVKRKQPGMLTVLKPLVSFIKPHWKLFVAVIFITVTSSLCLYMRGLLTIPVIHLMFPEDETTLAKKEESADSGEDDSRTSSALTRAQEELGSELLERISPELADEVEKDVPFIQAVVQVFTRKAKVQGYSRFHIILIVCGIAAVVACLGASARFLQIQFSHYMRSRVVIDIRTRLYDRICRLPVSFFDRERSGELISRLTNDLQTTHRATEYLFGDFVEHPVRVIVGVTILFSISWRLTIVSVFFGIFVVLPIIKIGQRIRRTARKRQEKQADLTDQMAQTLTGIRVVKAFAMEEAESERFREENFEFLKREMKVVRGKAMSRSSMELYAGISMPLLVLAAFWMMSQGTGDKALLIGYVAITGMLYQPLKVLSRSYTILQDSVAGMERVFEILYREKEEEERDGHLKIDGVHSTIEFSDVSFSYDGVRPVLRGVSFSAKAGEMIAIVGPSGAGKTTLLDLLVRFYRPKSGSIKIDGTDIGDLSLASLMESIAVVTQDPFLFNVGIGENIRYGRPGATAEEFDVAVKAAHVDDFVKSFPDGYDAMVGERGVMLSGGQRQRITIARALLKNAPILILDEATSNLDSESEKLIQRALPKLVKGRTTFVIAHRLSTVRAADRIVVMDEGCVAETGTHDELMNRSSGIYRNLHELQLL